MQYITKGTCSTEINFEVENNKITEISFTGGCSGNLQGICSLDQLAKALKELKGSR